MLFQLRLQGSTLQLYKNITPQGGIFDAFLNDKLYHIPERATFWNNIQGTYLPILKY